MLDTPLHKLNYLAPHHLAPSGSVAQLVEHHTGVVEVWVRFPLSPGIFLKIPGSVYKCHRFDRLYSYRHAVLSILYAYFGGKMYTAKMATYYAYPRVMLSVQ